MVDGLDLKVGHYASPSNVADHILHLIKWMNKVTFHDYLQGHKENTHIVDVMRHLESALHGTSEQSDHSSKTLSLI